MAFSWKADIKKMIRKDKQRVQVYLHNGRNVEAQKLKDKIKRQEHESQQE